LRRHKVPATLFVPTAYPNRPEQTFWWDDLYQAIQNTVRRDAWNTPLGLLSLSDAASRNQAYQQLKTYIKTLKHADAISTVKAICIELGVEKVANSIMSWESLRQLTKEGLTVGAHTRTHPLMNRIPLDKAREEAVGSLDDLKRELGSALPIFAYPSGELSDDVVNMLDSEGFALAFTTKRGINNISSINPLRIKRINVGGRTTLPILRAQLLSWTVHFNRLQALLDG
jgi:peptidoglycan/xylan/chitin deacetylase (PgdA/CDA1 family)